MHFLLTWFKMGLLGCNPIIKSGALVSNLVESANHTRLFLCLKFLLGFPCLPGVNTQMLMELNAYINLCLFETGVRPYSQHQAAILCNPALENKVPTLFLAWPFMSQINLILEESA